MITPFFHLDCFIYEPIEKMMESFKEKFKIAKVLASIFTHSSTLEENESYHKWINENPEHQKIADRILNKETYEELTVDKELFLTKSMGKDLSSVKWRKGT